MEYTVGTKITCSYNNRTVKGTVIISEHKYIVIDLQTIYEGKNESWDVGEHKVLYKKLIKQAHETT